MNKKTAVIIATIILSAALAIIAYPFLPEKVVTHWGISGEANGYSDKFFGTFLMPAIILLMAGLLILLPKIDPMRENIKKFYNYYQNFIIIIILFMLLLQIFTVLWSFGIKINISILMPLAIGALFFYLGTLIENAKRNWTIGIRTPWTLSSEKVWDRTHKLGGRMFRAAGIVSIIGAFMPAHSFFFVITPIMLSAAYLVIYSYLEYEKETRKGRRAGKKTKKEIKK